jgi:ATP-dependent exoDNAse (exonuclease V) alpha subunit
MKKEEKSLFEKLYEASEEQASRFAKEVVSHPSFSSIMEKALRNAMEAKGKIDKNVDQLLGLLNIPSKSDYNKLLAKMEALQGSLVNLNIKIDRLSAALEKPKRTSRRKTHLSSTAPSSKPTSSSPH